MLTIATGELRQIDSQPVVNPDWSMAAVWSPDSNWIAYTIQSKTFFRTLKVYSLTIEASYSVTDGMADVRYPAWDKNGKQLYFAASTDYGPKAAWLDLSTVGFTPTYDLYYFMLNNDVESPLLPESDEEEAKTDSKTDDKNENKDDNEEETPLSIVIDTSNTGNRIYPSVKPEHNTVN